MTTDRNDPANWKYASPDEPGLHEVISPENSACRETWIYRLNLPAGGEQTLRWLDREACCAVVGGRCRVEADGRAEEIGRLDAFYVPGGREARVTALEDLVLYIGAAPWEGEGEYFVRRYDGELPLGEVRQMHGQGCYQRQVWMAINQEAPGSRLICGLTWGGEGQWTSWPPHQHSRDLEEVYCYFDIPAPRFALHLAYTRPGGPAVAHQVSSGDMVVIPEGYHPTVGCPGVRSTYFWVMTAHSRPSRRYDLAVNDPNFG